MLSNMGIGSSAHLFIGQSGGQSILEGDGVWEQGIVPG